MTTLFTTLLNMSITASYVAFAVMAIRLVFRKAPKVFPYLLWLAVLVRLVCPLSFSSDLSLLRFLAPHVQTASGFMAYVPDHVGLMNNPTVDVGAGVINSIVNASLPPATPEASVNPMQITMELAGIIWVVGMVLLLSYSIISYLKLLHKVRTATVVQGNVFESDRITTPFVYGFIKPRIVIPVGLKETELSFILAHEQTHIRRFDYLIKPMAFLVLIVHWFNPWMWLSFALMSKDMEMSCDESVIRKLGKNAKSGYSHSLLSLAVKKSGRLPGSPLAFSQSSVHARIKNVLNYKKPTFGVVAAACMIVLIFMAGFTANPSRKPVASMSQLDEMTTVWAQALISREGQPRYEMMSASMKERFKQEQIVRGGENWNYNIGVSSPWVVDFEISRNGSNVQITYFTQTSEPAFYKTEEILTFAQENGQLVVADYRTVYEDRAL
ncbi:MAG: M56 family metallopeptidase [Paenibacillus sp.]|nr:M56 family metallopeptidase [Paenibacillus sp.]